MRSSGQHVTSREAHVYCPDPECGAEVDTEVFLDWETHDGWWTCPKCGGENSDTRDWFEY